MFFALIILALHAISFHPFLADDALISLRYAQRLLEGKGLTWTDGVRVEGYSNLLWVLCCSFMGFLGMDLIESARVLGFVGMGLTFLAIIFACRPTRNSDPLPCLVGCLILALSGPIAVWTIGGLEQPLVAPLLAWSLVLSVRLVDAPVSSSREVLLPSFLLALLTLTRPDGVLFTAAICLIMIVLCGFNRESVKKIATLASLPILFSVMQLGFRLFYYDDWFPNPAYAKLKFTGHRLTEGLHYIGQGIVSHAEPFLLGLTAVIPAIWDGRYRKKILFLMVPMIVWMGYVAIIGGDIFPARRHLVPVLVILALLVAETLKWFLQKKNNFRILFWIVTGGLLVIMTVRQSRDPENAHAHLERWEWDGAVIGGFLKQAFEDRQPLMAIEPAGCMPYFSHLPSLDMLGLNDRYLAHHPPLGMGTGLLAHELGNGDYVFSRHPDLVIFCDPRGRDKACYLSGVEMQQDPRFMAQYQLVTFEGTVPYSVRSQIWVRKESETIGIQRSDGAVTVPGFFLVPSGGGVARLDSSDKIGSLIPAGEAASLAELSLSSGSWVLKLEASETPLKTIIEIADNPTNLAEGKIEMPFKIEDREHNKIHVTIFANPTQPTHIRQLMFSRNEK